MRAALYRKVGQASEVLSIEEIPTPEPSAGQVRVRITASGVNPTDWKTRSGATGADPDGFQVPHQDGAGVIDAVGAGVSERHVGERVWCYLAAFENRYGTAAQYCVLPAERTVALPAEASDELGASLGVPAVTAAHCLGGDPAVLAGTAVLVAGGGGSRRALRDRARQARGGARRHDSQLATQSRARPGGGRGPRRQLPR